MIVMIVVSHYEHLEEGWFVTLGIRLGQNVFLRAQPGFAVRFTQTRHAPYSLSWVIQAPDGLDPGLSEKARTT